MRGLTLKQFSGIEAIARHGRITGAAGELHVTPAALTARLRQLEDTLGLVLFDRTRQGLKLTEAGQTVLQAAEQVRATLTECTDRLASLRGVASGRVRIAVVSTAKYFAPYAIAAFGRRYPGLDMQLHVGNREETIARLADYSADIAVMGRPARDFPVEHLIIGDHPLVLVAAPGHTLAHRRDLPIDQLSGETFLVREPGSGTRMVFEALARRMSRQPTIAMEIASNETIKQAVMAGLGIALLSAHAVGAEIADGRLVILPVEDLPIRRQWYAVRRADRHATPAMAAFWTFLAEQRDALLPQMAV